MIDTIVDGLLQSVPRGVGWLVLKVVTFGRYRGGQESDYLVEGVVGLVAFVGACWLAYAVFIR